MKKILFLLALLFITGCQSKDFNYEMKDEGNYQARITISGNLNNERINNRFSITKYNNNQISFYESKELQYYFIDGKFYNDNQKKEEITENIKYKNYEKIIKTIQIKKMLEKDKDLIGNEYYDYIKFEISKSNFNKLLENIDINYKFKTSGLGIVYNNTEGYISKIIYTNKDEISEIRVEIKIDSYSEIDEIFIETLEE